MSGSQAEILSRYYADLIRRPTPAAQEKAVELEVEDSSVISLAPTPATLATELAPSLPSTKVDTPEAAIPAGQLPAAKVPAVLLPDNFLSPVDDDALADNSEEIPVEETVSDPIVDETAPPEFETESTGAELISEEYDPPLGRWLENGRPAWAEGEFDVLILKVNRLSFAVPLLLLGQIQPITDELSRVFGQAPWFMGIQPTSLGRIRVLNTPLYIAQQALESVPEYLVSIDQLNWGLAFDEAQQPLRLRPEQVRWRAKRDQQQWMAGILKDQLCPLVDIAALGKFLNQKQQQ